MPQAINYKFFAPAGETIIVNLQFDDDTYRLIRSPEANEPEWTRLAHQKCGNCPLPAGTERCPAALALATFIHYFEARVSYEKAVIEVETTNRTIVSKVTFQQGMASLMGLVLATSGCPLTRFLRPMARFHLPFSNEQETMYRALSTFLLGQYMTAVAAGREPHLSLDELRENYSRLTVVNAALAERMRAAVSRDAALNAVIILDTFAQIAPDNIDNGFEDILHCFTVEED